MRAAPTSEAVIGEVRRATLTLGSRRVTICYPPATADLVDALFGKMPASIEGQDEVVVKEMVGGFYAVNPDHETIIGDDSVENLAARLNDVVISTLLDEMTDAVALHAGGVSWKGHGILVPGGTGAGKTCLVAWFLGRGCSYLSDEVVILPDERCNITGLPRALLFKSGSEDLIEGFAIARTLRSGSCTLVVPRDEFIDKNGACGCGLIIFPQYVAGAKASLTPLSPAEAGFRLMASNVNARNFEDGGLNALTALTQRAPAFALQYGGFEQLDGVLDVLAETVLERGNDATRVRRFLSAFGGFTRTKYIPPRRQERQPATPRPSEPKKLTIGMATYDDYDGVFFTLHALRIYHAEVMDQVELLVVDNHPDGVSAKHLKNFEKYVLNYRYVPVSDIQGTTIKEVVFREAAGEYVLCIDCHVLIQPGGVRALLDYFAAHPKTRDLVQGPLLSDNLTHCSTHQEPRWIKGIFGDWPASIPITDLPKEPIEIPFTLMALFACRRDAWVGFNPAFRGWGIEEWYAQEKFRRAGGKTVCLPALQYVHRFNRPNGIPYRHNWEERIRNYTIAFQELGHSTADMDEHFRELLGKDNADLLLAGVRAEFDEL
jgi:hypothetical protein